MGFSDDLPDPYELTSTLEAAEWQWNDVCARLYAVSRSGILERDPLVLYLGCRRGVLLDFLAEKGIRAVGVDIREPPAPRPGITIIKADAHHLPFKGPQFNLVYSFGMFDPATYNFDFPKVLSEVHRVTVPGGVFYIAQRKHPDVNIATSHGFNVLAANMYDFFSILERV